jgi:hypothetical protein
MQDRHLKVFLRGGLGNQLFQYSTGKSLARASGRRLILRTDLLPKSEDRIAGVSRWPDQISDFRHSGELWARKSQPRGKTNTFGKSMQVMRLIGDVFPQQMAGLGWISAENSEVTIPPSLERIRVINAYAPYTKLAFDQRAELRSEINDIRFPSTGFNTLLAQLKSEVTICIHIRRGDYLGLSTIFGSLTSDYFKGAVEMIERFGIKGRKWVFTDSEGDIPEEIIEQIRPDFIVGPETLNRPIEVLVALSHGQGLVASNSTLSWWAAFFSSNRTKIVAPNVQSARVNVFRAESFLDRSDLHLLRVD